MATVVTTSCDNCGRLQDTTRGWLLFSKKNGTSLSFQVWDAHEAAAMGHCCSLDCGKELLSKAIAGWR